MNLPSSISGFTVIPVVYSFSATHIIYARAHIGSKKGKNKTLPEGRTLFLVNLPPDATEREIILFFKYGGTVEKVIFDWDEGEQLADDSDSEEDVELEDNLDGTEKPRKKRKVVKEQPPKVVPLPRRPLRTLRKTGQCAHIIFLDSSSLGRALAPSQKPRLWPSTSEEPSGLSHYLSLYDSLRPPLNVIKEYADTSMEVYEYELQKTKHKSKYRKGEAIIDEDGFTLVKRGGAYGQTLGGGVGVASKRFQQSGETSRMAKKKKAKEKEGFYAFQKAEKQRNELLELKKNWEEDKAKIEKLKESRKFKPY